MIKWEYRVVCFRSEPDYTLRDYEELLDEEGGNGWELVEFSRPTTDGNKRSFPDHMLVFKRPVTDVAETE